MIFSGSMVRAILEGRKTQTRWICKIDPLDPFDNPNCAENLARCPYGAAGDRLYIKEALKRCGKWAFYDVDGTAVQIGKHDQKWRWKNAKLPARFMPKDYARLWLEITTARVERLQDISEEDAKAEGVEDQTMFEDGVAHPTKKWANTRRKAYSQLWDSLHGEGAWEKNPWVWVIRTQQDTRLSLLPGGV